MVRPYYYNRPDYTEPMRPVALTAGRMTSVVRTLIILNASIFFFQWIADNVLGGLFSLVFGLSRDLLFQGAFWQIFTYMFLHDTGLILHLAFNMLGLYFLGPEVERGAGPRHFLVIFFLSGVMGGLGWVMLSPHLCIGASGAVMGVIGAFVALYPNERLTIIFFPFYSFRAWMLAAAFIIIELLLMIIRPDSHIAHGVHVGGLITGFIYSLLFVKARRKFRPSRGATPFGGSQRTTPPSVDAEIDRILDKISKYGVSALSPGERALLDRFSRTRRE